MRDPQHDASCLQIGIMDNRDVKISYAATRTNERKRVPMSYGAPGIRVTETDELDGLSIWIDCDTRQQLFPKNINGSLTISAWFTPYQEAGSDVMTLWTQDLAKVGPRSRPILMQRLSERLATYNPLGIKWYVGDEGTVSLGTHDLVCQAEYQNTITESRFWGFLNFVDMIWPDIESLVTREPLEEVVPDFPDLTTE